MTSKIIILDFGSQYTQVIARRIRQLNVYSEIVRYDTPASVIKSLRPGGIIFSGGPASVYAKGAPQPDKRVFETGIPILGVCYGMQLFGKWLGGEVAPSARREYGRGQLRVSSASRVAALRRGAAEADRHLEQPRRQPQEAAQGFPRHRHFGQLALIAAIEDSKRKIYGLQFHPEVAHTPRGMEIFPTSSSASAARNRTDGR